MKRILSLLVLCAICTVLAQAQNRSINFERPLLSEALVKARAQNKLVFVDCYTEWCGPCKEMARTVFKEDSIADFFNSTFVNVQLDMEKGEGKPAVAKYKIGAYPSFLLLNGSGEVVYKFIGAMPSGEFMAKIREGINPANRIASMNKRYAGGDRSKSLLREYIKAKIEMHEIKDADMVMKEYFDILTPEERVLPENWYLFGENRYAMYISDVHSRNFNYLADHWRDFAATNGKQVVEAKMDNMYRKTAEYCLHGWYFKDYQNNIHPYNKAEFDHYREQINSTELADKKELIILIDIAQAAGEKDTVRLSATLGENFGLLSKENQRIAYTYFAVFSKPPANNNPGFQDALVNIIATAKDKNLAEMAKHYKR